MFEHYDHVIWDWNGTLFNDIELCVSLINQLLITRGLPALTTAQYREIFTFPVKDYYGKAGLDFSKESFEVLGKEWMENYELRKYECGLSSGAQEMLQWFSDRNIPQSILSAYKKTTLDQVVERFGLQPYFTHVVGLDNIYAAGKTDLGLRLMQSPELIGRRTVMIGDTVHDFEVAMELGVDSILIASGHQDFKRLASCNVPLFNDMNELFSAFSGKI